jgi:(2S)-methylsuccinyl-CoA dehydrogenase
VIADNLPMTTPSHFIELAQGLVQQCQQVHQQGIEALAQACQSPRGLSPERLDQHQLLSYDMAWTSAELLAAQTALDQVAVTPDSLDAELALVFTVETLTAVLPRLDMLCLELSLDACALRALQSSTAWADLRRAAGSEAALARTGQRLQASQGEIGEVHLDESIRLVQETFQRFGQEVVAPLAEHIHRDDVTIPETLLQPLREMGVFGLSVPEAYGGSGTGGEDDNLIMVAVTEALSQASLGAAGSLITRPEILCRALLAGGTETQKAHWLPRIAQGQPLCAIAMTEPDHGSDVASLTLRADRVGGGWRLNGAKTWCTFAGKAGVLMVVARTDPDRSLGHKGLSLLLVEKPSTEDHAFRFQQPEGGVLTGRAIPTLGYRGMHSYDVSFENWWVPDSHVIGEASGLGKGFYFNMTGMVGGRMQTAARACGVMRAALLAAQRYTQDRKVFGQPLTHYSLTQVKLARMAARYVGCRLLTYQTARTLEQGGSLASSLVKLLACRSAELVTREALQLHGGMGYAEETPVSRYFVDARVLSIFEGAEEILALKVIARGLLEQALRSTASPRGGQAAASASPTASQREPA